MKKQQSKQSRLVRHNDTCCSHSTNLFDRAETPQLLPDADGKSLLHLPTRYPAGTTTQRSPKLRP